MLNYLNISLFISLSLLIFFTKMLLILMFSLNTKQLNHNQFITAMLTDRVEWVAYYSYKNTGLQLAIYQNSVEQLLNH